MGKSKSKKEEKIYRSMTEFKMNFFPKAFKKKIEEKKENNPSTFGYELATEFLENIKRQI